MAKSGVVFPSPRLPVDDPIFLKLIKESLVIEVQLLCRLTSVPTRRLEGFNEEFGFRRARGLGKMIEIYGRSRNAKDSRGEYMVLNKKSGKWVLDSSSPVWKLESR